MNVPRLRFKGFSGEWEVKTLSDSCNKIMDGTHFSPKSTVGTKKYLTSKNIRNTGLDISDCNYISDEEHQEIYKKCPVKLGDVLLTKDGANTGNCCINTLQEEFSLLSSVAVLSGKENLLNTLFLLQILQSFKGINTINNAMAGQAISRITLEKINKFKFTFPEFPEQTKIANFLTAVDEKIAQLTQTADLLARYKKGVMQQIFSQQLRFKDDDGRDFPEWGEKSLGEFLIPAFREVEKPKESYLSIGIRSHCKGTFQKPESDPEKNAMDKLFQVKENDLIVNITFAWEGAIAIVKKEDNNGFVSHRFPTYLFKEEVTNSKFFQYVFIRPRFREQLDLISPGGAGRNRVMSKKDFLKIKCQLPVVPEQTKIANFLTALDGKISHNQSQLNALKRYKQGLLQQMFV